MKIVHICLAATYSEGWGYHENILAQTHAKMGYEVFVIRADYESDLNHQVQLINNKDYVNEYGIRLISLNKSKRYGWFSRYNDYDGVYDKLSLIKPDVIFVHGGQFIALKDVIRYCKEYKSVKLYIDNHCDYYNTNITLWKNKLVHKYIYGFWIRRAIRYCNKFWGVSPWRCDFLYNIYGVPQEKISLLVMGGDDEQIHFNQMPKLRQDIRKSLNLNDDDFVIITGGKIDKTKNIHLLIKAISELNRDKLKLIVFGKPNDEMQLEISQSVKDKHIRYIGWLDSKKVYDYFLSSDLCVFPGTHSVLWEQACACGIPCIFKKWPGMQHVDVGGNCLFLEENSVEEIKQVVDDLYSDRNQYLKMKLVAQTKGIKTFSYRQIAKKAIESNN